MIPAILSELDGLIDLDDVVVLVATGTHRANSDRELRQMFGDEVVDSVRIVNHDARDRDQLSWCGTHGDGVPVWLDSAWVEADVRITTGFVEPHFFAGFSGGPKLVAPGLAGLETVLVLHDAKRIGDPSATWGVTQGNPVHDDVRAIAEATGVSFALDVVLNRPRASSRSSGVTCLRCTLLPAPKPGESRCNRCRRRLTWVVTTNSGHPLDQNLYQAVKGMSAAHQIVRPGGTIVCAAECRDGFPDHGSYRSILESAESPEALLAQLGRTAETSPDQWQAQIQARIQSTSRVVMHTGFLTDGDLAAAHLEQTADISAAVADSLAAAGPDARLCILPEGPQTIPYIAGQ